MTDELMLTKNLRGHCFSLFARRERPDDTHRDQGGGGGGRIVGSDLGTDRVWAATRSARPFPE